MKVLWLREKLHEYDTRQLDEQISYIPWRRLWVELADSLVVSGMWDPSE